MINVGIIGAGVMGADHARLLGSVVAGASLAGTYDVDAERARSAAAAGEGARTFDRPADLIGDPGVDAVLIASSDATHERFVLDCLEAGKPVLCEKPLAPTVAACRTILEAEQAAGRRLVSVGFMRRHDPGYLSLKQSLDAGGIGAALLVHHVHRNVTAPAGLPSSMLITGSGVHEIDVTRWLLGEEITEVTVHRPRSATVAGATADPLLLVLRTASGVVADVEVFVNARYGYDVRCELVAENAALTLDAPVPVRARQGSVDGRALAADWRPRFAEAYRRELQDWVDAIAGGRPPAGASAWDGYAATAVAEAAVRALETGEPETVRLEPCPAFYR